MATEGEIRGHDNLITDSIDSLKNEVEERTKIVERRLVEIIQSSPNPQELAQNRALLLQAFAEVDNIKDALPETLRDIAQDTIRIQGIGEREAADTQAESVLLQVGQNDIQTELDNQKNTIVDGLIVGAVAGMASSDLAKQAAWGVSGLMADTNDPKLRKLQRELVRLERSANPDRSRIQTVVRQLREGFAGVAKGANLRELGKRVLGESVMKFEGAFSMSRMRRKQVKRYRYVGGIIETSRDFCIGIDGETFTEDEIYDIWNNEDWAGKAPGDPFVVRGGYNCRHWFVPEEE